LVFDLAIGSGTYQINMFEYRGNAIALSGDGSNEKRYGLMLL
jgi:hypothetical protein